MKSLIGYFLISFLCGQICRGIDWPTYGGPESKHYTSEETLRLNWGEDEPKVLWKQNVGLGYSSVIEVNGLAYTEFTKITKTPSIAWKPTVVQLNGLMPISRDLVTSISKAEVGHPNRLQGIKFFTGHEGPLFCLDAKTGKLAWKRHLVMDFNGICPTWGVFRSTIGLR